MPECDSVHSSSSGGRTSSYTALVGYSLPSASLTITVSNTPPGRASTVMRSRGVRDPGRAPEVGEMLGIGHAREDQLARRVEDPAEVQLAVFSHRCPPSAAVSGCRSANSTSSLSKRSSHKRRFVGDPVQRAIERAGFQVAGAELGVAPPRDQAAALQHLEVLGDPRAATWRRGRPTRSRWRRPGPAGSRWRAGWGRPVRRRRRRGCRQPGSSRLVVNPMVS